MEHPEKSQSAQREGSGAPVKRENPSLFVDDAALRDFDKERSDYLVRLDEDKSIIHDLRLQGFQGVHYGYFENELAKYGLAVINAWVRNGQIFVKLKSRGTGLPYTAPDVLNDADSSYELAVLTVGESLSSFRDYVLLGDRWDPGKGASIRTFFIGQCLYQFPNVYRKWHGETFDNGPMLFTDFDFDQVESAARSVEFRVTAAVGVDELLEGVKSSRTKEILVLSGAGYSQSEIAQRLGITTKAVERTIAYERERQKKGKTG